MMPSVEGGNSNVEQPEGVSSSLEDGNDVVEWWEGSSSS